MRCKETNCVLCMNDKILAESKEDGKVSKQKGFLFSNSWPHLRSYSFFKRNSFNTQGSILEVFCDSWHFKIFVF